MATQPGKRISSRNTLLLKRVFPILWFGAIAAFVTVALSGRHSTRPVPLIIFIVPVLVCVVGYFVMRRLVFDLADAVYDEGDALRVCFGSAEERIELANIINVSYAGMTNPPRVTLTLRNPGRFGREVTFSPQQSFLSPLFRGNPLVSELIERVDAARRR